MLLGEAAHAVSASVGQGCNSALQDVRVFCGLLEQYQDDWTKALPALPNDWRMHMP
jgi:kynurenine 3-monooxygenase